MAVTGSVWSPSSWRSYPALHQPEWPSEERAEAVRGKLATVPPLVFAGEARQLRAALAEVAAGRAFLLQAGDCAESFNDISAIHIREKLKILLQMAAVLTYGATLPVVKVGRIAGQYAKARTSPTEPGGDGEIPSFRGHMIHDDAPTAEARIPDPERMVAAYYHATSTLNLVRAFTKGGFADLLRVHEWNQEFVASSVEGRRYERLAAEIERALLFMAACGIDVVAEQKLHQVDVWTSHEGLVLDYEEALTRRDSTTGDWYDCSAHMLWIGERTRKLDGAHVEFFSGVNNPLGVKVGPDGDRRRADRDLRTAQPRADARPADPRFADGSGARLRAPAAAPPRRAGDRASRRVGLRPDARERLQDGFGREDPPLRRDHGRDRGLLRRVPRRAGLAGGVHLEFTGEDVTECLGGSEAVLEEQLSSRYMSLCDPRLNARQSLDLAFRLAELMRAPELDT